MIIKRNNLLKKEIVILLSLSIFLAVLMVYRYQFPFFVFFIPISFYFFAKTSNNFLAFLGGGILSGVLFALREAIFINYISFDVYLISVIIYGIFFFLPIFLLLFLAKKYTSSFFWFSYPAALTIGFWLYNFTWFHFPLISPLDGLIKYPIFLQTLDIWGEYFFIFLIFLFSYFLYQIIINYKDKQVVVKNLSLFFIGIILILSYGQWKLNYYSKADRKSVVNYKVLLIQPKIESGKKFDNQYKLFVEYYKKTKKTILAPSQDEYRTNKIIALTKKSLQNSKLKPDLIIWPERYSYDPLFQEDANGNFIFINNRETKNILNFVQKNQVPIITQTIASSYYNNNDFYNLATLINDNLKPCQFYIKQKLFIFGERFPAFLSKGDFLKSIRKQNQWIHNIITKKNKQENLKLNNKLKAGINICFENGFSDLVLKQKKKGANFFINLSNDVMFNSRGELKYQETASIFRAIENRSYYLRSTNVGFTEIINPKGLIISKIKPFHENYLYANIKLSKNNHQTFFNRIGYLFFLCIIIFYVIIVLVNFINKIKIKKNEKQN